MSASTSGQRQTQNSQTSVDAQTNARMGQIYDAGNAAGNAGPGPLLTGASDFNTGLMTAGATGAAALGGDAAATQRLMNPYQQQVIDANNAAYQKTQAQTVNQTNDLATRAGAFGGSRHGVAEGVALGNNAMAHDAQTAGLLYQGYGDTMNRASQAANLGYMGAGANSQLGFAGVGDPNLYRLNMLKAGYLGPTGTQSSGAQAQTQIQGGFKIPGLS
jgi:hypothetical protein